MVEHSRDDHVELLANQQSDPRRSGADAGRNQSADRIVLRHEETLIRMLEQITVMVGQHARFLDRLRALEERVTQLEER